MKTGSGSCSLLLLAIGCSGASSYPLDAVESSGAAAATVPSGRATLSATSAGLHRPDRLANVEPPVTAADAGRTNGGHSTSEKATNEDATSSESERAEAKTRAAIDLLKKRNFSNAARLFQAAANQGDPRAQTNLGWMYVLGQGVPRDDQRAMALFITASLKRFPNAQDSLGWMYQHGRGVAQDCSLAMGWYQRAADQGFEKGERNFAAMQRQGCSPRFEGPR